MSEGSDFSNINDRPKLSPLTPEYLESEHGLYVSEITKALTDPSIRNIALSGNYGVGKSSILKRVVELRRKDAIELSLSTLVPIETASLDESIPKQATTPTNQIQQEIVKQLLYREDPSRTPASRFRRIDRFRPLRELVIATMFGCVMTLVFILTGWTDKILVALPELAILGSRVHIEILGSITLAAFVLRILSHGRISIKQVSAGSATVTLDDRSVSYFDQYLDEIVYFFEVSKRSIVIFEDIDRFNDSHIFETLRALNTLLNASPQIRGTVRFIYAIKDSIFDQASLEREKRRDGRDIAVGDDPAQLETIRANRTKFFDLVIPVVPFITHQNARNLTTKLLREISHTIEPELIDLASRFVPDMRLLKNVRNEFLIFRDRIFSGDGTNLKLSESELFAMMLYKSTHLADFEAIRVGKSLIDSIYRISRDLVATNIRRIDQEIAIAQRKVEYHDSIADRSPHLGEQLIGHAKRTARACGLEYHQTQYFYGGASQTEATLKDPEFWRTFLTAPGDPVIEMRRHNGQYHNAVNQISFYRSDLEEAIGSLEVNDWNDIDHSSMITAQNERRGQQKFLYSADMSDLFKSIDLVVALDGSNKSLDEVARELLTPGLAYHLIRSGYINRNFTLYTSTFHGDRVGPAATNFIIHHVERDLMDEYFALQGDDVEAIVRECGVDSLREPAMYNIAMLDHLLSRASNDLAARTMIESLPSMGKEQARFLQAYLSHGAAQKTMIEHLTATFPGVLTYLVNEVNLDESSRLSLVSRALASLSQSVEYDVDTRLGDFFTVNYSNISALATEMLSDHTAARVANVIRACRVKVIDLTPLTDPIKRALVSRDLYQITLQNLQIALDSHASVALDKALAKDEKVFNYAIENLAKYVAAIGDTSFSVDSAHSFATILSAIGDLDSDAVDATIERASPSCMIADVGDAPQKTWRALAGHGRFEATYVNVKQYIDWADGIDDKLGQLLTSQEHITNITDADDADEAGRVEVAIAMVNAQGVLPVVLRATLASDLNLKHYLDVLKVMPESGGLFASLIEHDVIEDAEASYLRLVKLGWPSRELYIEKSVFFKEYMTPALVGNDVKALLLSERVISAVKIVVIEHAAAYSAATDGDGRLAIASYSIRNGLTLPVEVVRELPGDGATAQDTFELLRPHLDNIGENQLFDILNGLGGAYADLTFTGEDRPKLAFSSNTVLVLEALQRHNVVNSYAIEGETIIVNKNHG